jgi:formate dehydrogenase beta subunit
MRVYEGAPPPMPRSAPARARPALAAAARPAHLKLMSGKKKRGGLALRPAPKGRTLDPSALADVRALLGDAPRRRDLLIEFLHALQDAFGHLSARHLTALAAELRLTPAEVYEVVTFYAHFDIAREGETAPPPVTIRVCESISCHLAGAGELLRELADRAGANVRVEPAPCVGRCAGAPVAVVGHVGEPSFRRVVEHADTDAVEAAVQQAEPPPLPAYADYAAYRAQGGYAILADVVAGRRAVDDVIDEVSRSGLRGLGGAGFPTARKWGFVRAEPKPRVMALNVDEGEPGTFKDRFCLETDPHRVFEGMLIAAHVVEAADVYFYLRDEYGDARALVERELALLHADPPCLLPRVHLRRGAGAYICGEETSLIESIEGKRGEPRLRPPFPAQNGVFGRPTLVQNLETVFWLRDILEHGAEAFAARGKPGHPGARYFSVSGRVKRPGVYLAPNGVTARELVDMAGGMLDGHALYGYLPGGASGGILPASLADEPLDFEVLAKHGCFIGSAAIVVFSDHDRARDVAHNLMRFFAHESCGKCTPCRAGTAKSERLMAERRWNLPLLEDLAVVMQDASICGLGQAAPNPYRSVVRFFPQELDV